MKKITKAEGENIQVDGEKFCETMSQVYNLDDMVILARKGDNLVTVTNSDIPKVIIEVAHRFHNGGEKSF